MSNGCAGEGASMIVGSGQFKYRVNAEWARLPDGWSFKEVGGVGVDRNDNVYVFNRGEDPMIVFERQGNVMRSGGEGQCQWGEGVDMVTEHTIVMTEAVVYVGCKEAMVGQRRLEREVHGQSAV